MQEYVIATDDVTRLKKELAANVIGEIEIELSISTSSSTRAIWFTPQEVSSKGFTGQTVFHGLIGTQPDVPHHEKIEARIQEEGTLLVLITDL